MINPYFAQEITVYNSSQYTQTHSKGLIYNLCSTQKDQLFPKSTIKRRNLNRYLKFSILDPRRFQAEEQMYRLNSTAHFLHGPWKILRSDATNLFTSSLSRNGSPDMCRPSPLSLFLQPLCPNPALQSGSICSPVVTLDRRETLWKTRGALHKVRTINLDFEALICLAVPRGNAVGSATEIDGSRFTGDNFERRMQSRADDTVGIHPLPMSLPVPRGFILNRLAIIDWFPNEAPLSLCVSVRDRWRGVFQRMMIRKFGDEVCRDLVKYSYVLFEKYIYVYLFLLFYHSIFECIFLCFSVNILNYYNSICDKRYLDRCINCINCINCGEYI